MPEYLAPGVFVEEVSFRSKSIEGVATSTTGFVGFCRWGPVAHTDGPAATEPRLITSFTEFERVYGGLEQLTFAGIQRENYLAHAARMFFLNGGKRLYISRVVSNAGVASDGAVGTPRWTARWPGAYGNVLVTVEAVRRGNVAYDNSDFGRPQGSGLQPGAVVEVGAVAAAGAAVQTANLRTVIVDTTSMDAQGRFEQDYIDSAGATSNPPAGTGIVEIVLRVTVTAMDGRSDVHDDLAVHSDQRRFIGTILQRDDPEDADAIVWLDTTATTAAPEDAITLMTTLLGGGGRLAGGTDGQEPDPTELLGDKASPDVATKKATGMEALGEVADIAIVAAPDMGAYANAVDRESAAGNLIGHAEELRYRIAVVDGPQGSSINEIREFRGKFDSTRAALYHPWVEVQDPLQRPAQGAPPRRVVLPPSGFVTGIYARSDVARGVYKAPANEIVRGLTRFEANINTARNEVLNPEGINALRFFEGRGSRVWGARTMTSDPEWKYVNVRRLFIFLERSIDLAMQFAVFEPNNERLWSNIRQAVEDFLYVQWLDGALLGATPEEAYFVRCDRTTMTQNDLDNGRMICLIGVAPTRPAEFVIFRIGQWTADARS